MHQEKTADLQQVQRRYGSERDVAQLTGIAARTLQKWRLFGKGPRFYRVGGMIKYDLAEVDSWVQAKAVNGERLPR